jgi:CRISPR-associated protein Cmr5
MNGQSQIKTLDQIRAQYAWEQVQGTDDKYKNLAKGLPALVMSNGLMQTLAFLKGKGANEHSRLLAHILGWLGSDHARVLTRDQCEDFNKAMNALAACDSLQYQRATEETLAILKWIRYLAAAVG